MAAFAVLAMMSVTSVSCEKPEESGTEEPAEQPVIELVSPSDGDEVELQEIESIVFEWKAVEGVNAYKVLVSRNRDMSDSREINAVRNPLSLDVKDFDKVLDGFGVKKGTAARIYWTVVAWGREEEFGTQTRKMTVKRLPEGPAQSDEERIADPLTIKVAVLYEDPVMPGTDKYMHEVCTVGGRGSRWYDPTVQVKKFEADLEEASHGVVQYEIVKEVRAERLFSFDNTKTGPEKKYFSLETMRDSIYANGLECPGLGSGVEYDYVGMLKYYGFDKMRDNGEIHEVWVYNHPGSGMYESRLIGNGAFWCNSPGISTGAPCKELVTVMFCNYERTTDLALHSYGHRFESIMTQVYGSWRNRSAGNLPARKAELNNWELYASHSLEYEKYEPGYAQIGCTHFPPNGQYDYDYSNRSTYVYTYADSWYSYPDMVQENPRRVNCSEWKNDQQGWMMYFFSHMPHFKGLNEDVDDLHLNNWWYYVVDYNAARKYERQLLNEL